MGVQPATLQGRPGRRPPQTTDTDPPTTTITNPGDGAQRRERAADHDQRHRQRRSRRDRRRPGRRGRSLDGRRRAAGIRPTGAINGPTPGLPAAPGEHDDQGPRRRRQRQPARRRGDQVDVDVVPQHLPLLDLGRLDHRAPGSGPDCRSNSGSSSGPTPPGSSPASASTRRRETSAPTSGTSGPAAGTQLAESRPSPARPLPAGRRSTSTARCRSKPARPTSPPTTLRSATTPRCPTTSRWSATDSSPLHALADGVDGPNGVYKYGPSGGALLEWRAPSPSNPSNYLVDVVFEEEVAPDTTPPQVSSTNPAAGASGVATGANGPAPRSTRPLEPATVNGSTVQLRDGVGALVGATVSYSSPTARVTLDPERPAAGLGDLHGDGQGWARRASSTWPAIPLAGDTSWSFTTAAPTAAAAGRGTGWPDPGHLQHRQPVQPVLRRNPPRRRLQRVHRHRHLQPSPPASSTAHDVAILGEGSLSAAQAQMLDDWVQQGGNLIAMRPEPQLAGLLGLGAAGGTLVERLSESGYGHRSGRRSGGPDDPVPRGGRSLHPDRRRDDRDALLRRLQRHRRIRR